MNEPRKQFPEDSVSPERTRFILPHVVIAAVLLAIVVLAVIPAVTS